MTTSKEECPGFNCISLGVLALLLGRAATKDYFAVYFFRLTD